MIFEVINPSDPITIESDDVQVAQMATIFLGRGKYGLTDEDGKEVLPFFLLGGFEEWGEKNGFDIGKVMDEKWSKVADCLESAAVTGIRTRKAIMAAVGQDKDKEAIQRFNEANRSSMNDIAGYAHSLAKIIRDKRKTGA